MFYWGYCDYKSGFFPFFFWLNYGFHIENRTPTSSKGEEEALVRVFLKQCFDSLPHPLVPLVDELLPEVAVYFLGSHLLTRRQCHIIEVRHL